MRPILALATTLLAVQVSSAAPPLTAEKFRSTVQSKVAPEFGSIGEGKMKAFCVCNSTERVGVIESFNGVPNLGVTCTVPSFDATTHEYNGGSACYDWTPMAK